MWSHLFLGENKMKYEKMEYKTEVIKTEIKNIIKTAKEFGVPIIIGIRINEDVYEIDSYGPSTVLSYLNTCVGAHIVKEIENGRL